MSKLSDYLDTVAAREFWDEADEIRTRARDVRMLIALCRKLVEKGEAMRASLVNRAGDIHSSEEWRALVKREVT